MFIETPREFHKNYPKEAMNSVNTAEFKVQNMPFIVSQIPEHTLTAAALRINSKGTLGNKI
jgi:hypothetical protein